MLGPAAQLVTIVSGESYSGGNDKKLIFSVHCTKTNECEVLIETISGGVTTFPPGSFVRGAVYHIYIKSMTFDESKAGFIGYKLLNKDI